MWCDSSVGNPPKNPISPRVKASPWPVRACGLCLLPCSLARRLQPHQPAFHFLRGPHTCICFSFCLEHLSSDTPGPVPTLPLGFFLIVIFSARPSLTTLVENRKSLTLWHTFSSIALVIIRHISYGYLFFCLSPIKCKLPECRHLIFWFCHDYISGVLIVLWMSEGLSHRRHFGFVLQYEVYPLMKERRWC